MPPTTSYAVKPVCTDDVSDKLEPQPVNRQWWRRWPWWAVQDITDTGLDWRHRLYITLKVGYLVYHGPRHGDHGEISYLYRHTHKSVLRPFPWVSTPMVFQDNPGWPFSPQLKYIHSQISDCGMDSTEVPPSWPETDNVYKYLFYTSLP
jgi:hypothetical protein